MNVQAKGLSYHLVCIPDTNKLQEKVREILQENKDKILVGESLIPIPYTNRETGRPGTFCAKELWFMERGDLKNTK